MAEAADLNVTSEQVVGYNSDHVHVDQKKALEIAAVILWFMFLTLDLLDFLRYVPLIGSLMHFLGITINQSECSTLQVQRKAQLLTRNSRMCYS